MKGTPIFKNMLKNTYVLYGVLFVALTNILGYMSHHNYEAVIIFALVGFLTQSFSKNMIIILLVPIVFTAVFTMMRQNVREGVDNKHDEEGMPSNCTNLAQTACIPSTGCKWNNTECVPLDTITTLHPKWIKDDEKTKKDFYKNLPEDVDDLGIHEMTKRTEDLAKNQQNLRNTMTKMMPMMDQAQNILANIDTDAMKKMMDMAGTVTSSFKKSE